MSSTIIIGIGTTGLNIIEEAQQFHYEYTGRNKPGNNVEYIYIETDGNRNPKKTALGTTDIKAVKVPLSSIIPTVSSLKNAPDIDSSWVQKPGAILLAGVGAGGAPSYGRLSLWDTGHLSLLRATISAAHNNIGKPDVKILIVGTLTGGTGAGICVDVAYLVNEIVNNNSSQNTYGLFLLPNREYFQSNKALFENAFSALTAINKYEQDSNAYKVKWLSGATTGGTIARPPFEFVQYLSADFNDNRPPLTTAELIRTAGMITALQILETETPANGPNGHFSNLLLRRRVDSKNHGRIKNSLTAGFLMIQYPKSQLQELLAIKLSRDVLSSLTDSINFIDRNGNKKAIATEAVNIKKIVRLDLEEILKSYFEFCDGIKTSSGNILKQDYNSDVRKIINKNHGMVSNIAFYFSLFKTGLQGNYFDLLSSNRITLRDKLIEEIHIYISLKTKEFKNLQVTRLIIEEIKNYLTTIINFYKTQYKIDGNDNSWDRVLQVEINELEKENSTHSLLLNTEAYTLLKIEQLGELAKIHVSVPVLQHLQEELETADVGTKSTKGVELPTMKRIINKIEFIDNINNGQGDTASYTLKLRESEIDGILSGGSGVFKMLYTSGSKSEDINEAYNNYLKALDSRLDASRLFNSEEIWNFLNSHNLDLYTTCISNSTLFVKSKNFIGDADLLRIINNISPNSTNRYIKELFDKVMDDIKLSHIPPMVGLDNDTYKFQADPCSKLIFISNNYNTLNQELHNYELSPGADNTIDISCLNDTIVIYQEYGYMGDEQGIIINFNPLKHIGYMRDVKEHLRQVVSEEFKMKKVPYLTVEEFKTYIQ